MRLLCLVGYSLFLYIPCCIISTINFLAWPAVAAAGASSTLFLLRSLLPLMSAQKEKATTVVGVVCAMQVIFMLIVKVKFYTSGFWEVSFITTGLVLCAASHEMPRGRTTIVRSQRRAIQNLAFDDGSWSFWFCAEVEGRVDRNCIVLYIWIFLAFWFGRPLWISIPVTDAAYGVHFSAGRRLSWRPSLSSF